MNSSPRDVVLDRERLILVFKIRNSWEFGSFLYEEEDECGVLQGRRSKMEIRLH